MAHKRKETAVFTVGYQGLTIQEFVRKLRDNSIYVLVDVRRNPLSRKAGFSKTRLSAELRSAGIDYCHLPELGIPSSRRKNLDQRDPRSYVSLFDYYESSIVPDAAGAVARIKALAYDRLRIALACFEADAAFCHRSRLAQVIAQDRFFANRIRHI